MPGTPMAEKLRIMAGSRVLIVNAPPGYRQMLGDLPENVSISETREAGFDVVLSFFTRKADLDGQLERLKPAMGRSGILWIAYPKGLSKEKADLNRDILREHLGVRGLKAVALVSVDDAWSAMRFKKTS